MMNDALQRAIAAVGSQSALAKAIGKKQAHVWYWLHKAKVVPAEDVLPIERATHGAVSRSELRPDIYPPSEPNPNGSTAAPSVITPTSPSPNGRQG